MPGGNRAYCRAAVPQLSGSAFIYGLEDARIAVQALLVVVVRRS